MFKRMADEADNIGKLATQTGLTAEAIQELGYAAEQSGGSLEDVTTAVVRMQRAIVQAEQGSARYQRSLDLIGVSTDQLRGLAGDEQFVFLADAISKVTDEADRNAASMDLLGRASQSLWALVAEGGGGIDHLRTQLRDAGGVLATDAVEAAG